MRINPAPFLVIIFFFLSLFLYTKLAGPLPFSVNSVSTTKTDSFSVTGEGKVSASPDSATINLGVAATGADAKTVQDQMNVNINKVIQAIKDLGVKAEDIKTANYNVYPEQNQPMPVIGNSKISGYSANTTITIKVKNLDLVNQIIDTATANGANQIGGVNFEITNQENLENQAREKAVADAKQKADNAARIAGFKLGKIINYSENGNNPPILTGAARPLAADKSSGTNIQPGTNEITISVTLSYQVL